MLCSDITKLLSGSLTLDPPDVRVTIFQSRLALLATPISIIGWSQSQEALCLAILLPACIVWLVMIFEFTHQPLSWTKKRARLVTRAGEPICGFQCRVETATCRGVSSFANGYIRLWTEPCIDLVEKCSIKARLSYTLMGLTTWRFWNFRTGGR
jgi:hypothetical protein